MDYNATTPLEPEVIQVMTEAMREAWGNPSSPYPTGNPRGCSQIRDTEGGALLEKLCTTCGHLVWRDFLLTASLRCNFW